MIVNPYDPSSIANAIKQAMTLPKAERIERHRVMWEEISRRNVYWWTDTFLDRLNKNATARQNREKSIKDLELALKG